MRNSHRSSYGTIDGHIRNEYKQLGSESEDEYERSSQDDNLTSWMRHESVALLGEPESDKLTFFPATAIMVASMTGVGVLAFPATYATSGGAMMGIMLQFPFLLLSWITLIAIGMLVKRLKVDEYEEMLQAVFGETVAKIVRGFLFVYCLGNCIAYTLITIEQGRSFLMAYPTAAPVMTIILIPFIASKNVAKLKYSGYVSIMAMIVLAVTVALDFFVIERQNPPSVNLTTSSSAKSFMNLFSTFPIFCFAYQAHLSSVKIYRRIERPKLFPYISLVALLICFALYNLTGTFCLATWGAGVEPEMLNSYRQDDFPMYFARFAIIGCVSGAYPVFTIMARDLLYKSDSPKFRYGFAFTWYAVSLIGAILLPGFDLASKVIGSMAALLIFVFPGLALIVTYVDRKLYRAVLGTMFAVFGVFLFWYSLLTAFY